MTDWFVDRGEGCGDRVGLVRVLGSYIDFGHSLRLFVCVGVDSISIDFSDLTLRTPLLADGGIDLGWPADMRLVI